LKREAVNLAPPTLADVIDEIISRTEQSSLTRLKNAASIVFFLQSNNISDNADLDKHVAVMRGKLNSTTTDLKKVERRIKTLGEHLMHSVNFKNFRRYKRKYDELYSQYEVAKRATGFSAERKAQKTLDTVNEYHEMHHAELTMFDSAEQYLRDVLQERFDPNKLPPIAKWRDEYAAKTAEKDALYREYYKLKDDTAKVEKIQRSVKEILHNEAMEWRQKKSQGVEL
jgi:hypothetical protein